MRKIEKVEVKRDQLYEFFVKEFDGKISEEFKTTLKTILELDYLERQHLELGMTEDDTVFLKCVFEDNPKIKHSKV